MKTEGEIRQAFFNTEMIANPKNAPDEITKARAEERIAIFKWILDDLDEVEIR